METQGRERALVVDDNEAALFAVSAVVQGMGFDVDEADGPLAAIKLFDAKPYTLVVSDIRMPGDINGVQLAQILQKKDAGLSIILMTDTTNIRATAQSISPCCASRLNRAS